MGLIEILLGVVFASFLAAGFGMTLSGTLEGEFLFARVSFVVAAASLIAAYLFWCLKAIRKPVLSRAWIVFVGAVVLLVCAVGTLLSLNWVSVREALAVKEEEARRKTADLDETIRLLTQQAYTDQRAVAARDAVIAQWNEIKKVQATLGAYGLKVSTEERLAAAEHILNELAIVARTVGIIPYVQGGGYLVLQIAPNTFRITLNQPMFRVPEVFVGDAPSGAKPEIEEKSTMGATIIFKPLTSPVSLTDLLKLRPAFDTGL